MKKHYFLQTLTTSTIYHFNLCYYNPKMDYLTILGRAFRIKDIDLCSSLSKYSLSKKDISLDVLAYNILVYSFASLSGINRRSIEFKSMKAFLDDYVDMRLVHTAIKDFKPFYKIFKSDNYYGITRC